MIFEHPLCYRGVKQFPLSRLSDAILGLVSGQCPTCGELGIEFSGINPVEYIQKNSTEFALYPPFYAFGPIYGMHNVRELDFKISSLVKHNDGIGGSVHYKLDYQLPSGSFKYREAVAIYHVARALHVDRIIATSSGNTADALRILQQDSGIFSLRVFEWGPGKDYSFRSAAQGAAGEYYLSLDDKDNTLFVNGARNPLRLLGHQILGCELLCQCAPWRDGPWHYFQASGSGYGCTGVESATGGLFMTHRVRPVTQLADYAPALADAPPKEQISHVELLDVQAAYDFLAPRFRDVGLEAACALAGYWKARNEGLLGSCVVNLTGARKGALLPWT